MKIRLIGIAAILATVAWSASAALLSYMPYDGGDIGQTLTDTTAMGPGAIGFDGSDFDGLHSTENQAYVAGLSGIGGGLGNAIGMTYGRHRMIIDRTTPEYVASGIVDGGGLLGADGSTLYGSVLIRNPNGPPTGYTGLEFCLGNPNSNRKMTIGEAGGTNADWVVIGDVAQAGDTATGHNLPLPAAGDWTRQILYKIDFGAGDADTITLLNPDGTDIVTSDPYNLTFSTLHLANYTSSFGPVYDEIRLATTFADLLTPPPSPPPPLAVVDMTLSAGSALELKWYSMSNQLYDVQMTTDLVPEPPPPTTGTPIQFAFGGRSSAPYAVGTDGPAHQEGSLTDVDDQWNTTAASLGSTDPVADPSGTLFDTRGAALPAVVCDLGTATNAADPIDWAAQPRQSGIPGPGAEFANDLYGNNVFTDGRSGPLYIGANVTGLAPGDYEVYALVREPSAMDRMYDSSIGVITAADLADGVSFGDPGLTTSVGTSAVANGTLDLDSEYFLTDVTVTDSSDAIVVITRAVTYPGATNEFGCLNGVQIVVPQAPAVIPEVSWTNIAEDVAAAPPTNTFAGVYTPMHDVEYYRVIEKPPAAIFFDDFEGGQGDWTVTNASTSSTTEWELGTPDIVTAQISLNSAYSGDNCWGTALTNVYDVYSLTKLRSPVIDLTGKSEAELSFQHVHDMEGLIFNAPVDFGEVNILDAASGVAVATNITGTIVGEEGSWDLVTVTAPLPPEAMTEVMLEFVFETDSYSDVPRAGWYIDDVTVR